MLATRHFTSAWVARALPEFGVDPRDQRIRSAVGELYTSHRGRPLGLGAGRPPAHRSSRVGDLDALRALEAYVRRASRF